MQCFVYLITCINIIPTVTAPGLLKDPIALWETADSSIIDKTQISSLELLNSIPLGGSKISPNVRQQANVLAPRVYDCSRWYCMTRLKTNLPAHRSDPSRTAHWVASVSTDAFRYHSTLKMLKLRSVYMHSVPVTVFNMWIDIGLVKMLRIDGYPPKERGISNHEWINIGESDHESPKSYAAPAPKAVIRQCQLNFDLLEHIVWWFEEGDGALTSTGDVKAGNMHVGPRIYLKRLGTNKADANLKSVYLCYHHVLPIMEGQKGGGDAMANVSSIAGMRYIDKPPIAYSTTKASMVEFTKATTLVIYGKTAVRSNMVAPIHRLSDR
ncbi:short-chain dehydrogenase [Histoplasma capsulatum G186AR]|uniref:Short-chain dehydrogenase n=2 Tax=Ajellomyces capsulatus TaxID=5037 RepID=C0NNJ5_AJECG|nr:short-chain dehydrogenase [Histoplasma capsulatum G186AR]EEH06505.1 short-chain dehydrogenase [Histoplasma capsulatum G186AR]